MPNANNDDNNDECPADFICPITSACFVNPVIAADGHTYDRSSITEWFKKKTTSPMTREVLEDTTLRPNLSMISMISAWRAEREGEAAIERQLQGHLTKIYQGCLTSDELTTELRRLSDFVADKEIVVSTPQLKRLRKCFFDEEKLWCDGVKAALELLEAQCEANVNIYRQQLRKATMLERVATESMMSAEATVESAEAKLQEALEEVKKKEKILKLAKLPKDEKDQLLRVKELYKKEMDNVRMKLEKALGGKEEKPDPAGPPGPFKSKVIEFLQICKANVDDVDSFICQYNTAEDMFDAMAEKYGQAYIAYTEEVEKWQKERVEDGKGASTGKRDREKRKRACAAGDDGVGQVRKQAKLDATGLYEEGMQWYHAENFRVKDERRGKLLIETAAEQGDACAEAYCIYQGWGGRDEDDKEAFKRFLELSEKEDHVGAMYLTGSCYDNGNGVEMDKEKAAEWYTKAAKQGNVGAQCNLGCYYGRGEGVEEDDEKAVEWYTKAAKQGDSRAQSNLGTCYDHGLGVEMDKEKAVEWYTKAAKQGDSDAQVNLGWCYDDGNGVEKDKKKAVEWYTKAAKQGHSRAQYNLGCFYWFGDGVEEDDEKAMEWYTKAAKQGHSRAQYNLGDFYRCGDGVEEDKEKAVEWYTKAAKQGHRGAQYDLGYYYGECIGVKEGKEKEMEWNARAIIKRDI